MANYRWRRPRTRTYSRVRSMNSWPAWWDTLYNRRPQRRRVRYLVGQVVAGRIDADDVLWPAGRKPHTYYW